MKDKNPLEIQGILSCIKRIEFFFSFGESDENTEKFLFIIAKFCASRYNYSRLVPLYQKGGKIPFQEDLI